MFFTVPCISQINSTALEGVQIKWLKDPPAESDRTIIYAGGDRFSRLTFIWPRCTLQISHPGTIANLMMSDVSWKRRKNRTKSWCCSSFVKQMSFAECLGCFTPRSSLMEGAWQEQDVS